MLAQVIRRIAPLVTHPVQHVAQEALATEADAVLKKRYDEYTLTRESWCARMFWPAARSPCSRR